MRFLGLVLLVVGLVGCGPAAVGESCELAEDGGDRPCEGDALCIAAPDALDDYRCAPPCAPGEAGCTRESCESMCVPPACTSTADCPFGTACEGRCVVVID